MACGSAPWSARMGDQAGHRWIDRSGQTRPGARIASQAARRRREGHAPDTSSSSAWFVWTSRPPERRLPSPRRLDDPSGLLREGHLGVAAGPSGCRVGRVKARDGHNASMVVIFGWGAGKAQDLGRGRAHDLPELPQPGLPAPHQVRQEDQPVLRPGGEVRLGRVPRLPDLQGRRPDPARAATRRSSRMKGSTVGVPPAARPPRGLSADGRPVLARRSA